MSDTNVPRSVEMGSPVTELNGVGPSRAQLLASAGIETVGECNDADRDELLELDGIGHALASKLGKQSSEVYLRSTRTSVTERGSESSFLDHGSDDVNELDVALIFSQTWNNGRASRDLQARVREALNEVSEEYGGRIRTVNYLDGASGAPSNAPHKVVKFALDDLNERLPDRAQVWPMAVSIPWTSLPEVPEHREQTSHDRIQQGSNGDLIWTGAPRAATERITDRADVLVVMDDHDFVERDVNYAKSQRTDVYFYQEVPEAVVPSDDETRPDHGREEFPSFDGPEFDASPMDTDRGRENPYSEQQATLEEEDRYADWTKFDREKKSR